MLCCWTTAGYSGSQCDKQTLWQRVRGGRGNCKFTLSSVCWTSERATLLHDETMMQCWPSDCLAIFEGKQLLSFKTNISKNAEFWCSKVANYTNKQVSRMVIDTHSSHFTWREVWNQRRLKGFMSVSVLGECKGPHCKTKVCCEHNNSKQMWAFGLFYSNRKHVHNLSGLFAGREAL